MAMMQYEDTAAVVNVESIGGDGLMKEEVFENSALRLDVTPSNHGFLDRGVDNFDDLTEAVFRDYGGLVKCIEEDKGLKSGYRPPVYDHSHVLVDNWAEKYGEELVYFDPWNDEHLESAGIRQMIVDLPEKKDGDGPYGTRENWLAAGRELSGLLRVILACAPWTLRALYHVRFLESFAC